MTTQTKPAAPARQARPSRGLLGIVVIAVVAAIGIFAFFALTGDSNPTVTFDGETAVYDGPATLEAGEHTFVFDGSAFETENPFAFGLGEVKDRSMTDADIAEYEDYTEYSKPEFIGRSKIFWITADAEDRVIEETFLLDADTRYAIHVLLRGGDQPAYFAATFEVE